MAHLSRSVVQRVSLISRAFSTTAAQHGGVTSEALSKKDLYCQTGEREVVGYGYNGYPTYMDREDFPCPAVRFAEDTPEILALRKKEEGDWKNLSLDEKKALYRASFCQTFTEFQTSPRDWKSIVAAVLMGCSVTGLMAAYMKAFVYPPRPVSLNDEWHEESIKRMVVQRQGHVDGVGSMYDYEKNQWK